MEGEGLLFDEELLFFDEERRFLEEGPLFAVSLLAGALATAVTSSSACRSNSPGTTAGAP